MTVVRPATRDDVAQMHDMILALAIYEEGLHEVVATAADLERVLFGDGAGVVRAHVIDNPDGPGLAGMAIWFLNYSTWEGKYGLWLEDLYVRDEHRGKGYGRALMEALAQVCVENDYTRFGWWVLDWNTPAIEVYTRLGAVPMDEWTVYRLTGDPLNQLGQQEH